MIKNKDLKRRILQISYDHKLSHLGSCLTAVDIIDEIYAIKKPNEKFVLSSGHAGLALYTVLEKYDRIKKNTEVVLDGGVSDYRVINAEKIFEGHGVHPDRCEECGLDCSTGSLGQGLPIAVGMALADRSKNVYCLISDGECAEGSIWEALRIKEENSLTNLKIYCNINGWGAYKPIDFGLLIAQLECNSREHHPVEWVETDCDYIPFLRGQQGHYKVMNEEEYNEAMDILK